MKRLLLNIIVLIGLGNVFASEEVSKPEDVESISAGDTPEMVDVSDAEQLEKMSDNLKSNNPFIPFKTSSESPVDSLVPVDISNFEFFSVVKYADHYEFGLREKNIGQAFWLSSKQSLDDAKIGVRYWSFSPIDRMLVVQDIISGDLVRIIQAEPNLSENKSSSSLYSSDSSWSSLLDDLDDNDDISID